ncbi:ImmA/IrrE family metallo-endopeptidase [Cellulomonas hominis]|nr:ImmA/IrrE family metallo-endopeptidase [Cellulomonas hominis]MBB5472532.1 Zn-dependent peptidase ImmA (M78 family) [Cellulomonas hominis]NKY05554.1 ImmA/IrrE family metallo-endopeptidase [Cellulomonas hominis]
MEELLALATERGVRVAWRDLGRRAGEYHSSGLILLNPRRTETVQRVTLAHELGHAHYGHTWTDDPREHEHRERLADRHGARLLISPSAYAAAERLVGPHPGALARELGVTASVVETWRADALRAGIPTQRGRDLRVAG